MGGVAAAIAAAERGAHVVLTEKTDWVGGQLTSQAVPPDEHPWIEDFGCTARYRRLRDGIREHYRTRFPLTAAARGRPDLNPGAARVSRLSHEPKAALAVLEGMLGGVEILLGHSPTEAHTDGDRVTAVHFGDRVIEAEWVIDATETGELLPLAGVEHVTGTESQAETGEPHAPPLADPLNMQPVSACFALDHLDGEDHTIARPAGYETFRDARPEGWPEGQLSWSAPDPRSNRPVPRTLHPNPPGDPALIGPDLADPELDRDLWLFRRIPPRLNFDPAPPSDITLVNWPQMDYLGGPVFGTPDAAHHAAAARRLSLSLLHWMQTEGGFPGLRLRGDVVGGTPDGLAKALYIRESRRIRGEHTIAEQEIAFAVRGSHGAVEHPDGVGIGAYRIDLHPSTGGDPYIDIACCPFQIPLGALIPVRVENLLAGAKNIATTHITNGAYRLHPVEWNIGEAAGHLAAYCGERKTVPRAVRRDPDEFRRELEQAGVELRWPPGVAAY